MNTIKIVSVISTQRSYFDLLINCREVLPTFFGFDYLGILFRDTTDDYLFSYEEELTEAEDL